VTEVISLLAWVGQFRRANPGTKPPLYWRCFDLPKAVMAPIGHFWA
jgi:hypothetical protein